MVVSDVSSEILWTLLFGVFLCKGFHSNMEIINHLLHLIVQMAGRGLVVGKGEGFEVSGRWIFSPNDSGVSGIFPK